MVQKADDHSVLLELYVHISLSFTNTLQILQYEHLSTFNSTFRPDGKTFRVPPADILIPIPTVGEIVTYTYDGHNAKDLPVSPQILRVRRDLLWLDVVLNYRRDRKFLNGMCEWKERMADA